MQVKIINLNDKYINLTIKKTEELIEIPSNLVIYFVKGNVFIKSLPKKVNEYILKGKSFSYNTKKVSIIFIQFNKRGYLLKNNKALIGLVLHEIMHVNQRNKGLDEQLKNSYRKHYLSKLKLLKKLDYNINKLNNLFLSVGETSVLLSKELHTNTELIKNGLSEYLLQYYKEEFPRTKKCPKPVFYDKFKREAMKDIDIVKDVFEFEFSLLSFILPFRKLAVKNAKSLINHIHQCYEINIDEIARKCKEITFTYNKDFEKKNFQKEFFEGVFFKVYDLLI